MIILFDMTNIVYNILDFLYYYHYYCYSYYMNQL